MASDDPARVAEGAPGQTGAEVSAATAEGGVGAFLRERIPLDMDALKHFSAEPVPYHLKRWWFALGGTPAYLFLVQIVTGILLAFYYVPEPGQAYDSVRTITDEVAYGWYFRSLHKWSASLMIAAVILHAMRVFFTGAYRKPRELTWMSGALILIVTLVLGFTGYSLIYEQLSYWGATVAGNLTQETPVVGPWLARLIRGGDEVGGATLTRFFVLHAGVLPVLLTALLIVHLALVRAHGVAPLAFESQKARGEEAKTFPFFPDHVVTEVILGASLMIVLTALALIFPAGLGEAADPLTTPEHIKPEWYFFFTFRWLKLTGLTAAILSLGFAAFLFVVWPFVDGWIRRRRPGSEISVWLGAVVLLGTIALTLWEAIAPH